MFWIKTLVGVWCYQANWSGSILLLLLFSRLWAADYYGYDVWEKVECWTIEGHSSTRNSRPHAFKLNYFLWNKPFSLFWMFIAAFMHCLQAILKYIMWPLWPFRWLFCFGLHSFSSVFLNSSLAYSFNFFLSISWNIFLTFTVKDFHLMPPGTLCTQATIQWQSTAYSLGDGI